MPVTLPADRDRDAWQVALWNAPDNELSRPQKLELMQMLESGFNAFDPFRVVRDLLAHRGLWDGVVMCRLNDLITLRDIASGRNVDTVYVLHDRRPTPRLRSLAAGWQADEVDEYRGRAADGLLGGSRSDAVVLRVWWD
ncbi:MAG: hypothetical protein K2X82_07925 [Gemmataceae bacterium]|nr:hypothetical protein [Gemmataceae bacterium]